MMSEDDRAAKAARAKALLNRKKKQREKAGGVFTDAPNSGVASPISSSRAFSPASSELVEDDRRDLGDVFSKDNSDTSWLTSLPRIASPPPPLARVASPQAQSTFPPPVVAPAPRISLTSPLVSGHDTLQAQMHSLQSENTTLAIELKRLHGLESKVQKSQDLFEEQRVLSKELEEQLQRLKVEKRSLLQNEQQTISLLVSEKSSLTAELRRLEGVESKALAMEDLLEEERLNSKNFDDQLHTLRTDAREAAKLVQESQARERELADRCREQERELQLTAASINDLRKEADEHERKVRELQEQIQNDDRVERLENSLKNTQDRADELEFQLSKLKQVHTTLKAERDQIDSQRRLHSDNESEWQAKYSELHGQHSTVLQQLSTTVSEKEALGQEKSKIQAHVKSTNEAFSGLQQQLVQAASENSANAHRLQTMQNELRSANRRADDAEKTQKDLQAEGTNLMRSLDEMRPKIVELTAVKLELAEKIGGLEHILKSHEATIAQLESTLDEVHGQKGKTEERLQEVLAQHEKERILALSDSSELQQAYAELQEEHDTALASLHNLEAERSTHHHEVARRLEEIERLTGSSRAQAEKIFSLEQELHARRNAQDEEQDFLRRAQNEIESLRADLNHRDDEIERLREEVSSPSKANVPHSLDDEMLSSLRQQYALDLSAAQSQIRALENSVFDAEARSHVLQKQVSVLEGQLPYSRSRPASRLGQRSFSPAPSRPSSRARNNSDLRRSSFGSHKLIPPLSRSVFDQNMSAETRYKRMVSLSMLKARIDSEVAATSRPSSRASSVRALSPVPSLPGQESSSRPEATHLDHPIHRPQFLDDSHIFWCHSCSGDLVIL